MEEDLSGYLSSYEADGAHARKDSVKDVDLSNYVQKTKLLKVMLLKMRLEILLLKQRLKLLDRIVKQLKKI